MYCCSIAKKQESAKQLRSNAFIVDRSLILSNRTGPPMPICQCDFRGAHLGIMWLSVAYRSDGKKESLISFIYDHTLAFEKQRCIDGWAKNMSNFCCA